MAEYDPVTRPRHYNTHPSGVEAIQITEHMGFNLGNAMKYIWRADEKGNARQDLEKAKWYIERELLRRGFSSSSSPSPCPPPTGTTSFAPPATTPTSEAPTQPPEAPSKTPDEKAKTDGVGSGQGSSRAFGQCDCRDCVDARRARSMVVRMFL